MKLSFKSTSCRVGAVSECFQGHCPVSVGSLIGNVSYSGVVRVALGMGSKVLKLLLKFRLLNLSFCLLQGPKATQAHEQN